MEERITVAEVNIENIDKTVREYAKIKKPLTQNVQEIQDKMRRLNLRIIGIEEDEEYQIRGTVNIFNKIIEENFPTLKNEMTMSIKQAYRTPNRVNQKRNSSDKNSLNTKCPKQRKNTKSSKGKKVM